MFFKNFYDMFISVVQLHGMHCLQFHDLCTQLYFLQLYDVTLSTVGFDSYNIRDSQYSRLGVTRRVPICVPQPNTHILPQRFLPAAVTK